MLFYIQTRKNNAGRLICFFGTNFFSTVHQRRKMSQQYLQRIQREYVEILENPLVYATAGPIDESDLTKWHATLAGPRETPYEGGIFKLHISFPKDYPYKPPKIRFITKVYHCNVSTSGSICLDILKDQWSPVLTVPKVLISILSLLDDPEPSDPLVPDIAELYVTDRVSHDIQAREWTAMYAK